MSTQNLYRGENRLISRLLFLEDGTTELPISSLLAATAYLYQGSILIATYVIGTDGQLRAGQASNELILELTTAFTAGLTANQPLSVKWKLSVTDADFSSEPDAFTDIQAETLYNMLA